MSDLTDGLDPKPTVIPVSKRAAVWHAMKEVAPELWTLCNERTIYGPPPRALPDGLFVQLVACLADTKKREILRKLLLDLLADDIVKQVENPYEEEQP